ncbi:uncharacterized protein BO97DRAFT_430004 [Aspergillus homomorphus CBS 101889]|uniref:Uncharacterized protein n=1 Tax=Aspergillus homomorphus (strain CBS 101889) TaxID=1450537 RepID=A0A395HHP9_ASPHC|nr:hypothetical protein BO97DRAFT_430004 [Aspergillus homomorphus CBS 101889]RAL06695.1 hypothetical protein BO97DRAFT_430004 [Aspergillus homomorphus CBS 101889]
MELTPSHGEDLTLADLSDEARFPGLWYRLHLLLYDLLFCRGDRGSQSRLGFREGFTVIAQGLAHFTRYERAQLEEVLSGLTRYNAQTVLTRIERHLRMHLAPTDVLDDFATELARTLRIRLRRTIFRARFQMFVTEHGLRGGHHPGCHEILKEDTSSSECSEASSDSEDFRGP